MGQMVLLAMLLVLAAGAHAVSIKHIAAQDAVSDSVETSVRFLPEGGTTKVTVLIPGLDLFERRLYSPGDASRTARFLIDVPEEAEGDYLVRHVIADDDGRIVRHRWVTVE